MRVEVSDLAENDLREIGRYTQRRWGARQRSAYLMFLDTQFAKLAQDRNAGRARDEIAAGIRSARCGAHVVFFRRCADAFRIVRILHAAMDPTRHRFED